MEFHYSPARVDRVQLGQVGVLIIMPAEAAVDYRTQLILLDVVELGVVVLVVEQMRELRALQIQVVELVERELTFALVLTVVRV
jgi:hypothetical protein